MLFPIDYTLKIIISSTFFLGLVSGALGSFALLRKQSLLGDAMSHAALPGLGIAFLVSQQKLPFIFMIGAFISGWIGTLLMMVIVHYTTLKRDAALGIILSTFFGFGLVLKTHIQHLPLSSQSGFDTYIFGNASTLLVEDFVTILVFGGISLLLLLLFWKEFKLLSFDSNYLHSMGFSARNIDLLLTTLIVVAIVIGLQAVGVVLMSAMLIAPAASARQWTDSLSKMVIISAFIGGFSGMIGAIISSLVTHLPTGPTIIVVLSVFVLVSLFFSPNRGLFFSWYRHFKNRQTIQEDSLLCNMLLFSESATDPFHPHDISALHAIGRAGLPKTLSELEKKGYIVSPRLNHYGLTNEGLLYTRTLLSHQQESNT